LVTIHRYAASPTTIRRDFFFRIVIAASSADSPTRGPRPGSRIQSSRKANSTRDGLPQEGYCFTELGQAMAGDARDPAGVPFGANSGSAFANFDEGDGWSEIARHLPTILSLEVLESA